MRGMPNNSNEYLTTMNELAAAYATLAAVGLGMVMFGLLYAIALDAKA